MQTKVHSCLMVVIINETESIWRRIGRVFCCLSEVEQNEKYLLGFTITCTYKLEVCFRYRYVHEKLMFISQNMARRGIKSRTTRLVRLNYIRLPVIALKATILYSNVTRLATKRETAQSRGGRL